MRRPAFTSAVIAAVLAGALAAPAAAGAASERIGRVYPIVEPDLMAQIMARLREKERSGELARLREEAIERAKHRAFHPAPADNVRTATAARTFYYDPSLVTEHNVTGEDGRILVPAGTRVNPLDHVSLSSYWLFFDARDARQVAQAEGIIRHYEGRVKPILTQGDYPEIAKHWGRRVYYDQHGLITRKLGITQVPALVSQDGARLRIDEMLPEPLR
jgi:conjugal transfer pilus assembly protein TraW